MGTKASTWVGGAVVAALVMIVAAWFLLISPIMATASTASSDADSAEAHNQKLQSQLTVLKKQFSHIEEYQAQLEDLQAELPEAADLESYVRSLDAYAEKTEVFIVGTAPGTPVAVVPQVPEEVQKELDEAKKAAKEKGGADEGEADESDAPADGTETTEPADDEGSGKATAAQPTLPKQFVPIPGFVAVPIDVTVVGNAGATFRFMEAMQNGKRPFLVTAFQAEGQDDEEAQGGRPATHLGDAETKISGFVYVLQDTTTQSTTPADPEEKPAPLPKPKANAEPYAAS